MSRQSRWLARFLGTMMGQHERAGPMSLRLRAWMMRNVPGQLTCIEFESFVHDFQEGTLSPREKSEFEFHMELCPMCRVHFASYLQTIELGKRLCDEDDAVSSTDLPEELVAAILAARSAR